MSRFIAKDVYERFKDQVWRLTNAKQRLEPGKTFRGLSDREIALQLDLTEEEVIEIRCIADKEMIPLEEFIKADDVKEKRFKRVPGQVQKNNLQ